MRRSNSISPTMRTHRRMVKAVRKSALLDRPHVMPGGVWPIVCPAGLGRPDIKPPFLQ